MTTTLTAEHTDTQDADFAVKPATPAQLPAKVKPLLTSISVAELLRERPKLASALVKASQHCKAVPHDARNDYHKYDYTSSEAIIIEAKEAMGVAELALLPVEQSTDGWERTGEGRFERVSVYLLMHSSGESMPIVIRWPICVDKGKPLDKATAAADTLSLAYLLRDTFQMPRVDKADEVAGREDRPAPPPEDVKRGITLEERLEIQGLIAASGSDLDKVRTWLKLKPDASLGTLTLEQFRKVKSACIQKLAKKEQEDAAKAKEAKEPGDAYEGAQAKAG